VKYSLVEELHWSGTSLAHLSGETKLSQLRSRSSKEACEDAGDENGGSDVEVDGLLDIL